MTAELVPFAEYWWLYLAFTAVIIGLLLFDLSFHRKAHAISVREAIFWCAFWVTLAAAFCVLLYLFGSLRLPPGAARRLSLEFLAGYVVEESLSVDNMFVFAVIFRYFAVPSEFQHRVLFYGILGVLIVRGLFIAVGVALIRFDFVILLFGLFLIVTGLRMAFGREKQIEPGSSPVIRLARRFLPVTSEFNGDRFFGKVNGVWHITPLMIVLLFLESTDVMFAVDSVPAVFGVTREPFIVYTSNIFAVLGLRAMYFLLAGLLNRFHALQYGLGAVLVFLGVKMVWLDRLSGGRLPIGISLSVIAAILLLSVILSLAFPKQAEPCHSPSRRRMVLRAAGVGCLLLGALSLICAAGAADRLVPLAALAQAPDWFLYQSAACYTVCGCLCLAASRPDSPTAP